MDKCSHLGINDLYKRLAKRKNRCSLSSFSFYMDQLICLLIKECWSKLFCETDLNIKLWWHQHAKTCLLKQLYVLFKVVILILLFYLQLRRCYSWPQQSLCGSLVNHQIFTKGKNDFKIPTFVLLLGFQICFKMIINN